MMKTLYCLVLLVAIISCSSPIKPSATVDPYVNVDQNLIGNATLKHKDILTRMYGDPYFPEFMVDKCKYVFINLCLEIELKEPESLDELYKQTAKSTIQLNNLENEFYENGSEIETVARECFAQEFDDIAKVYGFDNADVEILIAKRTW